MANKLFSVYREENTPEYKIFKRITKEDDNLVSIISSEIPTNVMHLLDIGGREGEVSSHFSDLCNITIVDPDEDLKVLIHPKINFINSSVQNVSLEQKRYDLIIASHVWGDLYSEKVSEIF